MTTSRDQTIGLADKRGTFQQVLGRLTKNRSSAARVAMVKRAATAADDPSDVVDPHDDGTCPDGYEKDDDGLCYLATAVSDTNAANAIQADTDAAAAAVAIAERL